MTSLERDVDLAYEFWDTTLATSNGKSGVGSNDALLDTQFKYPDDVWAQVHKRLQTKLTVAYLKSLDQMHPTTDELTKPDAVSQARLWS